MLGDNVQFTPLSQEETLELLRRAKNNDEDAKNKLVAGNFPLIKAVLKRYQHKGVEYDDLYQLGSVGFLKAIANFDEKFGVKFSTYAVPMIAGEIKRFLRDDGLIKVSRATKALAINVRAYIDEYKKEGKKAPSLDDIARHFDVDSETIVFALDSAKETVSIYEKTDDKSENSPNLIDKIILYDNNEQMLDLFVLKTEIEKLAPRDKQILILRYYRGKTQAEVAEMLGVSQVQVSRLESKIIEVLRKKMK
ncbi:MAG: sigma-70 family RNA polymerase sigma factor [Clostridia bacterium]|nr:sigma-70 family RNA polymerase sigma factor [Clostridia bacterium]